MFKSNPQVRVCILTIILFSSLVGCAKIKHIDQLLTLKDYSEEGDLKEDYVVDLDQKFDLLMREFNNGIFQQYKTKKQIYDRYGPPVYTKNVTKDGRPLELWLYRYQTDYFNTDKIYMYFEGRNLVTWEHTPANE